MEDRPRLALAAGGTAAVVLGALRGGLIVIPDPTDPGLQVSSSGYFLSMLGFYLLVRAAGGHRTVTGCIVSIAAILALASPFRGGTIFFFLIVLPLAGTALGAVIISAAAAHAAQHVTGSNPAAAVTPAEVGEASVHEAHRRTSVRTVLIAFGAILILASLTGFIYLLHVLSNISMD